MLINVSKGPDQSMENYLCHVKVLVDSVAVIQSPVFELELIQFTISGFPSDYHTL